MAGSSASGELTPGSRGDALRVLHLTGDHEDSGGILSVIRALQEESDSSDIEHVLVVNPSFRQTRAPKLKLLTLPGFWGDGVPQWKLVTGGVRGSGEVRRLLSSNRFDVLHAHTRGGYVLGLVHALRYRTPRVVFTNHTYARNPQFYRVALRVKRFHTVFLTPNMRRHYGVPENHPRVSVVSECFRESFLLNRLHPVRTDARFPIDFVGVGNIVYWKKWHLLLEAIAGMPDELRRRIRFRHYGPVLGNAGSRGLMASMKRLIAENGLHECVEFCGETHEVGRHVASADWFVLPSTNEPCSVALLEALALGRPALVSRSGGNVDIVQEGENGVFFEPDDVGSLAQVLTGIVAGRLNHADPASIRTSVSDRRAGAVANDYAALYRRLAVESPK